MTRTADGRRSKPDAVLLIGIHREELAFGEAVASRLSDPRVDLLRIPEGITGRRPRPDQVFRAEAAHRELYHQIATRIQGRYRLLIDLHCGLDDQTASADLLSTDRQLLAAVAERAISPAGPRMPVRPVMLLGHQQPPHDPGAGTSDVSAPLAFATRTLIPAEVWNAPHLVYAGIEVYRRDDEDADALALARWLIATTADCFRLSRLQMPGDPSPGREAQ